MKVLKIILIALGMLIIVPMVMALFTKKEYAVEREIIIQLPKETVFEYIKYLKNQQNYSKWATMDPNQVSTFRGVDGEPGFVYAWVGNDEVGEGEQEIISIREGESIDYELRFIKPFESTSAAYISTEKIEEFNTLVKWGFNGKMNYPMNAFLLFMDMDSIIGEDLEFGLQRLKSILED